MYKILSLLLAFNVLVGSVGVPVSRHFCGGELKSFAIFGTANSCHAEKENSCPSHPKEGCELERKNCCGDEFDYIQLDEDREVDASKELPSSPVVILGLPARLFSEVVLVARLRKLGKLEAYRPPPLVIETTSRWEVYLI